MLDISARHKKTREKCCSPNISNGRRLTTGLERNAALLILVMGDASQQDSREMLLS